MSMSKVSPVTPMRGGIIWERWLARRSGFLYKKLSNSKLGKSPLTSNTSNIKLDNRSIISDATYNLFKISKNNSNKNYEKILIKKIESPFINKGKNRSKTTSLRASTECCYKNKKSNFKTKQNKKLNKINSIIININNTQNNETYFGNKTNERKTMNDVSENNDNYFYDFSLNKIKIKKNEFKANNNIRKNYNSTYDVGNDNNYNNYYNN